MRKTLLVPAILFCGNFFAQNNCDNLKTENSNLRTEIQAVKSENDYLKKILEINQPLSEVELDNNNFKITKVIGSKTDKTIVISFLVEAKDENKKLIIQDISIIDLEGNEYKIDLYKSSRPYPELATNVPMKLNFSFKEIENEPKLIKLFRFRTTNEPKRNTLDKTKSNIEFRDLKVIWN